MSDEMKELLDHIQVCKCCGDILFEIDPEDICMTCVDLNCNVKDENNV